MKNRILVLGLGNLLLSDEGLGVQSIDYMLKSGMPDSFELVDGGTGGFHLLSLFEDYQKIIIIDAALDDNPTGTIRIVRPRYSSEFPKALTTHDVGLKDLVETITAIGFNPDIVLIAVTIQPGQILGLNLSTEISRVIPQIRQHVINLGAQFNATVLN